MIYATYEEQMKAEEIQRRQASASPRYIIQHVEGVGAFLLETWTGTTSILYALPDGSHEWRHVNDATTKQQAAE